MPDAPRYLPAEAHDGDYADEEYLLIYDTRSRKVTLIEDDDDDEWELGESQSEVLESLNSGMIRYHSRSWDRVSEYYGFRIMVTT